MREASYRGDHDGHERGAEAGVAVGKRTLTQWLGGRRDGGAAVMSTTAPAQPVRTTPPAQPAHPAHPANDQHAGDRAHGHEHHGPRDHHGRRGGDDHGASGGNHPRHPPHGQPGDTPAGDTQGQPAQGGDALGGRHAESIQVRCHAVAAGDGAQDRTSVGVGEHVTFSVASAGTWRASAGVPTTATGPSFEWAAPATGGDVTITVERRGHPTLRVTMDVRAPIGVAFRKLHDLPQAPAGAGMRTNLTFAPTTVSFANVEWRELGGAGDGAPQGVHGYFAALRAQGNHPLVHNPNPEWLPMGEHNHAVDDLAYTTGNPRIDGAYTEGGYHWNIPNQYRVGGRDDTATTFANVPQFFEIEGPPAQGRVTVRKGGQHATQELWGATGDATEAYATEAAAAAYLDGLAGRGRRAQLETALTTLTNLRGRDEPSARNLAAAIRAARFELYVSITCVNAYSWVGNDAVRFHVVGQEGWQAPELSMHDGDAARQRRSFSVPLNSVFDWDTWSRTPIRLDADVESTRHHPMSVTLHWPYQHLADGADVNGSGGRYRITAFVSGNGSD